MEIIAILTAAKEMGFDVGHLISLGIIAIMIMRNIKKFVTAQNAELSKVVNAQVDKVVRAIEGHNSRLDTLEKDVKEIKKKIEVRTN